MTRLHPNPEKMSVHRGDGCEDAWELGSDPFSYVGRLPFHIVFQQPATISRD